MKNKEQKPTTAPVLPEEKPPEIKISWVKHYLGKLSTKKP
jgi:hypothetical protein